VAPLRPSPPTAPTAANTSSTRGRGNRSAAPATPPPRRKPNRTTAPRSSTRSPAPAPGRSAVSNKDGHARDYDHGHDSRGSGSARRGGGERLGGRVLPRGRGPGPRPERADPQAAARGDRRGARPRADPRQPS